MQTYPDEIKAQVIAEWKAGSSLNALVKAHGVPKTTVAGWVRGHDRIALVPSTAPKKEPTTLDLDEMAVRLIHGSVDAGENILALTGNEKWLARQSAGDLAILFGVIFDKLARLARGVPSGNGDSNSDPVDVHGAAVVS